MVRLGAAGALTHPENRMLLGRRMVRLLHRWCSHHLSSFLENPMFKYSEINMNFEVTLYCAE